MKKAQVVANTIYYIGQAAAALTIVAVTVLFAPLWIPLLTLGFIWDWAEAHRTK